MDAELIAARKDLLREKVARALTAQGMDTATADATAASGKYEATADGQVHADFAEMRVTDNAGHISTLARHLTTRAADDGGAAAAAAAGAAEGKRQKAELNSGLAFR